MKYARLTLSLLAAGLLAACSSAPSTDGQGAAVEDRSSASARSRNARSASASRAIASGM